MSGVRLALAAVLVPAALLGLMVVTLVVVSPSDPAPYGQWAEDGAPVTGAAR